MTITNAVIIIIPVICLVLLGIAVYISYSECRKYSTDKISFKEALDLVDLPVITFNQGSVKLNFILDTGATNCIIDGRILKDDSLNLDYKVIEGEVINVNGIENNKNECSVIEMPLYNKGILFENTICVSNIIGGAFDSIKRDNGVTIHGLLGTDFFEKYKYVLDFKEKVAYSKK